MNHKIAIKSTLICSYIAFIAFWGVQLSRVEAKTQPRSSGESTMHGNKVGLSHIIIKKPIIPTNPVEYLKYYATEQGLSQYEVNQLSSIMSCESKSCSPRYKQNPVSSAAGCFQIVKSTWVANSDYDWSDRYDDIKNIQTAIKIYQSSGPYPWSQCL